MTRRHRSRTRRYTARAAVLAALCAIGLVAAGCGTDSGVTTVRQAIPTSAVATTRLPPTSVPPHSAAPTTAAERILPVKVAGYRWTSAPAPTTTMPADSGIESVEVKMLVPDGTTMPSPTSTTAPSNAQPPFGAAPATAPATASGSPGPLIAIFRLTSDVASSNLVPQLLAGTTGVTITIEGDPVTETHLRRGAPDCTLIWPHDPRTVVVVTGGTCDSLRPVMAAIIVTG